MFFNPFVNWFLPLCSLLSLFSPLVPACSDLSFWNCLFRYPAACCFCLPLVVLLVFIFACTLKKLLIIGFYLSSCLSVSDSWELVNPSSLAAETRLSAPTMGQTKRHIDAHNHDRVVFFVISYILKRKFSSGCLNPRSSSSMVDYIWIFHKLIKCVGNAGNVNFDQKWSSFALYNQSFYFFSF